MDFISFKLSFQDETLACDLWTDDTGVKDGIFKNEIKKC